MERKVVKGGHKDVLAAIDAIIAGATPTIISVLNTQSGFWIIIHSA